MFENTHMHHRITNLPETFNTLKSQIKDWKEELRNLQKLSSDKIEELNKLEIPSQRQIGIFRNNLLDQLIEEVHCRGNDHILALKVINTIKDTATKFSKCSDAQEEVLNKMEDLECNSKSCAQLQECVSGIMNNEEEKDEESSHKFEIQKYLTSTKEQQKNIETKLLNDLKVDQAVLDQRWPSKEDLRSKLHKIIDSVIDTHLAYE